MPSQSSDFYSYCKNSGYKNTTVIFLLLVHQNTFISSNHDGVTWCSAATTMRINYFNYNIWKAPMKNASTNENSPTSSSSQLWRNSMLTTKKETTWNWLTVVLLTNFNPFKSLIENFKMINWNPCGAFHYLFSPISHNIRHAMSTKGFDYIVATHVEPNYTT